MPTTYPIGQCRYQRELGELHHPQREHPWQLPRVEKQLLDKLLDCRGQVISKKQLRQDDTEQLAFSDSAVVKGIHTLRHYIGDEQHQLLQTITGKGYRLATIDGETTAPETTQHPVSRWLLPVLIATVVIVLGHIVMPKLARLSAAPPQQQLGQFTPIDGNAITVHAVANSSANAQQLERNQQQLAQALSRCNHSRWNHAYLALSNDNMVLNITLIADQAETVALRNIKITDFRLHGEFIDQRWLQEADLCDENVLAKQ